MPSTSQYSFFFSLKCLHCCKLSTARGVLKVIVLVCESPLVTLLDQNKDHICFRLPVGITMCSNHCFVE